MAVSTRLRFEILRRDGFRCRYCGTAAADTELTVDHVTPVTLGGTDEPSNLATACPPCNSGKSSTAPDEPVRAALARTEAVGRVVPTALARTVWGLLATFTVEELAEPCVGKQWPVNCAGAWQGQWMGGVPYRGEPPTEAELEAFSASVAAAIQAGHSGPVLYAASQLAAEEKDPAVGRYAAMVLEAIRAELDLHALPSL